MRDDLVDAVLEVTGQRGDAFFSTSSTEPDVAVETFLLVPEPTS